LARSRTTHLELREDFYQLSWIHGSECLADHVQSRRSRWNRYTLREVAEERCSVLGIRFFIPIPFSVLTFAPLCARFATINELSAHCCLALEERVRICKVDSERSATNIDVIEVSDGGQSGFVVYRLRQLGKWEGMEGGKDAHLRIRRSHNPSVFRSPYRKQAL
jgi:hypothetical protein